MVTEIATPTRERIVEVSRLLFATNGYHGSSIRDIARELDVSVSAVYNHFASKDAILVEVLRRPIVEMTERIGYELSRCPDDPPREQLTRCLRVHYRRMLHFKLDADLLSSEYLRLSDRARPEIVKLRNGYEAIFRRLVVACVGERPDASAITNIILGLTSSTHRWFNPDGGVKREEMAELFVTFALGGLDAVDSMKA